jgi:hypothetical protein
MRRYTRRQSLSSTRLRDCSDEVNESISQLKMLFFSQPFVYPADTVARCTSQMPGTCAKSSTSHS